MLPLKAKVFLSSDKLSVSLENYYLLNIIFQTHGKKILKILKDVFCWLPLATLVDEKVLILHGGVSDMTDLELLAKLDRHKVLAK